jgi:hypothetical protein
MYEIIGKCEESFEVAVMQTNVAMISRYRHKFVARNMSTFQHT